MVKIGVQLRKLTRNEIRGSAIFGTPGNVTMYVAVLAA